MSGLVFHDDVPRGITVRYSTEGVAEELRSNPGKWAVIQTRRSLDYRNVAPLRASLGPGFEVVTRINVDRQLDVWARYAGGGAQ